MNDTIIPARDISLRIKISRTFSLLLMMVLMSRPVMAANETFTNEDISEMLGESEDFKKSHSVMIQQRERLKAILNAFLVGDTQTIDKKSDELLKAMGETIQIQPLARETESATWQSLAKIVKETHLMKEEASKNDYNKAYKHFSNIAASCIQCHQAVREWGQLPKPAPEVENSDPEQKKSAPNTPIPLE